MIARWIGVGLGLLIFLCVASLVVILALTRKPPDVGQRGAEGPRIPASAVWHDGRNGGSWIDLLESKADQQFHLKIFRDGSGELEADSWYQLSDNCRDQRVPAPKFHDMVQGYDGKQIRVVPTDGRQHCFLRKIAAKPSATATIYYRVNGRRVPQPEFEKLKSELELAETFTEGEMVRAGGPASKHHDHGFVHIWEAKNAKSGKKFQYSIEAFDEETIYSIQAVNK